MLKIQDQNSIIHKQWENIDSSKTVIFTLHNPGLLSIFESEKSITIFYGMLDQDMTCDNVAEFVAQQLDKSLDNLNNLYGSFILIRYDQQTHKFILANDALGDFALHYVIKQKIIFASDMPKALVNKNTCHINHQRLLHYFALTQPQNKGSFYDAINQLNAGHYLIIDGDEIENKKYYNPPEKVNYRLKSVESLAQEFNALMQKVINLQSQKHQRIGVMMSGGMDSTFVTANCLEAGKEVNTFSYVFPTMPEANESLWIDAMRVKDMNMHTFSGEVHWPLKSPWHISLNSPISNPYRLMKSVIYNQCQNKNIKMLFSGVFADHLYTGYIYWLVDMMKRNPIRAMASLLRHSKDNGIKEGLRQISPAKWSKKIKISAPWLTKEAFKELVQNVSIGNKHPHTQQFALAHGIATAQSAWLDNEYAYEHNIFVRHPFRDRRVVEFLTSIPAWILGSTNHKKNLAQVAAKDLLPGSIIRREKTTTLKPIFKKGVLDKEIGKVKKLLMAPECQWHNYVKESLVLPILKNPKAVYDDASYMILWQCIGFELWRKRLNKYC